MVERIAIAVTLAVPAVVHAAPTKPEGYVSAGVAVGADSEVDWIYTSAAIDAGYRLDDTWWLHGNLSRVGRTGFGTTNDITLVSPRREWDAIRIGVETQRCTTDGALCGFVGADAGVRIGPLDGWLVVPRAGLDVGGQLRLRAGVELLVGKAHDPEGDAPFDLGLGLTIAAVYQW